MSDRSLRGMRLGAQSMETESGVEPAPRQRVEYRCEDGEQVFVTFSSEAEIPPVWVSKTGKEALLVDGERPDTSNEKAVRTHWDMLLERRSLPELEQILEDRLTILRERRGDRLHPWMQPIRPFCVSAWLCVPASRAGSCPSASSSGRSSPTSSR
jgi:hypothetical protein